jgi:hypothetical protein
MIGESFSLSYLERLLMTFEIFFFNVSIWFILLFERSDDGCDKAAYSVKRRISAISFALSAGSDDID